MLTIAGQIRDSFAQQNMTYANQFNSNTNKGVFRKLKKNDQISTPRCIAVCAKRYRDANFLRKDNLIINRDATWVFPNGKRGSRFCYKCSVSLSNSIAKSCQLKVMEFVTVQPRPVKNDHTSNYCSGYAQVNCKGLNFSRILPVKEGYGLLILPEAVVSRNFAVDR